MNVKKNPDSLLSPFSALDLTDEKGFLCGRILGDLGADVIKIEKPGGDPARDIGPFYHDIPDPEKSLFWFAFNANKRGITLDIENPDGQEIFKQLVKSADFVIESFPPGYMDSLGLGYLALSEINPKIILTSITPFGQTGPYKDYKASDLIAMAMGGQMYLCGDPDRPPVRVSFPQAYCHAGAQAAMGTMIAHIHRGRTGEGEHIDVSMQECVAMTLMYARLYWDILKVNIRRAGPMRVGLTAGISQRQIWPCKDGHVVYAMYGGRLGAPTNRALVKWMDSEGMAPEFMKNKNWESHDMAKTTQEEMDSYEPFLSEFFMAHTRQELFDGAIERRAMLLPVATAEDLLENPQPKIRGFWSQVEHPELGSAITYPGPFAKLTETPLGIRCRAPLIGEHNKDIYEKKMGFSKKEMVTLKKSKII